MQSTSVVLGILFRFLNFCQSEGDIFHMSKETAALLSHWGSSLRRISLDRKSEDGLVTCLLYGQWGRGDLFRSPGDVRRLSGSLPMLPRLMVTIGWDACALYSAYPVSSMESSSQVGPGMLYPYVMLEGRWPSTRKALWFRKLVSFLLCLCSNALSWNSSGSGIQEEWFL